MKVREKLRQPSYASVANIQGETIERVSTGIKEFDWMYGYTKSGGGFLDFFTFWGIPRKTISLWSGESGTGKSRVAVLLSKLMVIRGYKVLYFQGELPVQNFVNNIHADETLHKNLYLSEERTLEGIVSVVYDAKPDIVIVDSVNQIPEYKRRDGADILVDGDAERIGFRQMCNENNVILILLAQVNQDGSVKGGTTLPHLVDIHYEFEKSEDKQKFIVHPGIKHRYGKMDTSSVWRHTKEGCECISNNRLEDEEWTQSVVELRTKESSESINIDMLLNPERYNSSQQVNNESEISRLSEQQVSEESEVVEDNDFTSRLIQGVIADRFGLPGPEFSRWERLKIYWRGFKNGMLGKK